MELYALARIIREVSERGISGGKISPEMIVTT